MNHRVAIQGIILIAALSALPALARASKATVVDSVEEALRFEAGDEAGNESKALRAEILIQNSEKKALIQLQRLVKKHTGGPLEPDLLFRLSELYMRRARSERFFEAHRGSDVAIRLAPDVVKDASEQAEIRRAITIYEDLQTRFVQFRMLDVVIFNEAFAREQLGEMDAAEVLFLKIPARFADSPVAADSWLAMGEISYQRRQYGTARDRFLKVKQYSESRAYPYALYKAAWCQYNLQDAAGAMKQLEEVVAFGREAALTGRDAKLDLRKEALNDLSLFFGDAKSPSVAVTYFTAQAQELDASPYIMKLIEIYKRHARFADVEVTLKDILAQHPDSPMASGAQQELIANYDRQQKRPEAIAELEKFEKSSVRSKEPNARETCAGKVADAAQKLASKWHALWKKRQPTDELAVSAEKAYALYFRSVGATDSGAAQGRFAYAELLFQRAKYREASDQYAIAASRVPTSQAQQVLARDAAYGAMVALERAVEGAGSSPTTGPGPETVTAKEPARWSEADEAQFKKIADVYLKANPNGEHALETRFKIGYIAYEKERYTEAAAVFKQIGWNPRAQVGQAAAAAKILKAQDLYLDILNLRKDFRGLRDSAKGLLDRADLALERRASMEKIYRQAYFSEIQETEQKGELKSAIAAYKTFAMENRTSDLAPKAWWNASQLLFRSGDAEAGANACYQLHKLFPDSPNGKDCLAKSAQTFEAMGRLDLAARVLLNLALEDVAAQDKWRELSADFFALSGNRARAITAYEKLSEGKPSERKAALLVKIQALAKAGGDMAGYRKARARIASLAVEPQASAAAIEEVEESLAAGQQTEAFGAALKILGRKGASGETHARARFIQAMVLEDEFRRQSVKARPERLAMVLAMKTERLEKAQSAYQSTIRYGDPRMTAQSLRRLAGLYRGYADALREVSAPEGSSTKDAASFKNEIERLAVPLEEKGVESLAQALEAAKKAGLREGAVGEIQAELDKANLKKPTEPAAPPTAPGAYAPRLALATNGRGGPL